jgi:uncharacterized membrane protein YhaH (DUF805 family)
MSIDKMSQRQKYNPLGQNSQGRIYRRDYWVWTGMRIGGESSG